MNKYDELINSLQNCKNVPNDCDHSVFEQTVEAIKALQSVLDEKQKQLDVALDDLAKCSECKHCSNLDRCSIRRIERTLAYGKCRDWQWRGTNTADKAS
ncbi:MAG: hypothetical protein CVU91_00795 [Firmicutes bacterium HGW-Firmicutes-16]|nr:MAG: hypothetical protein CVU91_00795 [Firmicutes bacterium HGW-Firmicutes-16]